MKENKYIYRLEMENDRIEGHNRMGYISDEAQNKTEQNMEWENGEQSGTKIGEKYNVMKTCIIIYYHVLYPNYSALVIGLFPFTVTFMSG